MPNANSFPDGQRGRVRSGDLGRVAEYAASALPTRGPGMLGRRFPQGSTCFPLRSVRRAPAVIPLPYATLAANPDGDEGADPSAVYVQINPASTLRASASSADGVEIDGLGDSLEVAADDQIWLQVDTDDGENASGASIESGDEPPYDSGDSPSMVTLEDYSDDDTPDLRWSQTFLPLAQVFAADASGKPTRGGTIFRSADGSTVLEIVSLLNTHLVLVQNSYQSVSCLIPQSGAGATV